VERGLLTTSRAAAFTDREALELICLPGFSTAPAVTEISGHGVGMDVVKTTVEQLGGTLRICSAPGAGCRIQLGFPVAPVSGTYRNPQTFPDHATAAVAAPAPEVGHAVS
jgi:two-component system chemotaxis sensor kinase CheA